MRFVIGAIMMLCFFDVHAVEVKVKKMTAERGFHYKFNLKTSLSDKVVLDCQSFIQGLTIGEKGSEVLYLLGPYECEALQNRIKGSLSKFQKHCLDLDDEIRSDYSCR